MFKSSQKYFGIKYQNSQPFTLPHPNLDDFDRTKSGSTPNLANPPNQSSAHARSRSDSKDDTKKHAPKLWGDPYFP